MNRTTRQGRRRAALLATSVGLHAVLLALLAAGGAAVRYRSFDDPAAVRIDLVRPQQPIPRHDTGARAEDSATEIRVRPAAPLPIPSTVAPSPFTASPQPPGKGQGGNGAAVGTAPHPGPMPEGPQANIHGALRGSVFACTNAEAVGLNRREREACDERMGAIGLAAKARGADIDPTKRRDWDYDAAVAASKRRRGQAPIGQGVDTSGGPGAAPVPFDH